MPKLKAQESEALASLQFHYPAFVLIYLHLQLGLIPPVIVAALPVEAIAGAATSLPVSPDHRQNGHTQRLSTARTE